MEFFALEKVKPFLEREDYNGKFNQLAKMMKFIDDQRERSNL